MKARVGSTRQEPLATRISTQAVMALSQHGPVGAILHQRTDYASAMTDGRVAPELDPGGKSAEELCAAL